MRTIVYYLPAILTVIAVILLDDGLAKKLLLAVLLLTVVFAKYKRSKMNKKEVEYDERVNVNIRYWSFGFIVVMNALLIVYFLLVSQSIIGEWLTIEHLIIYLTVTLLAALYVIPAIAKKF